MSTGPREYKEVAVRANQEMCRRRVERETVRRSRRICTMEVLVVEVASRRTGREEFV
jgi:hypothetical protein